MVKAPISALATMAGSSASILKEAKVLESKGRTVDAAGCYLKAAADAYELLASREEIPGSDAEKALLELHNSALARFAETWSTDPRRDGSPGPFQFNCDGKTIVAMLASDSTYHSGFFDRAVAAKAVKEKGVASKTREGLGAALVGIRDQRPDRVEEMDFFPMRGLHVPVTLTMDTLRKKGDATYVTLSLRNPLLEQSCSLGRRDVPVAADFSAPIAVILKGRNEAKRGLDGFFKADQRIKQSGIFLLEPYDPDRIPVLLIHGLISVPIIWRDIIPDLMSDPKISRKYQFMVFTYPSSYNVAESALLLRDELAKIRAKYDPQGKDPLSRNMVVAGHSMGGILTHILVADIRGNLWKQFSDVPFDQVEISAEKKERIRRLLFFEPDPAVQRAIFFSAPHRGANMAEAGFAGMLSNIAKLPVDVLATTSDLVNPEARTSLNLKVDPTKKATSVQSLKPESPMVAALDASPYRKGVIYHSVIGDRGKGDTPNSSDGVVDYWSSHQDGATSELIVPTNHGSYKSPLAIDKGGNRRFGYRVSEGVWKELPEGGMGMGNEMNTLVPLVHIAAQQSTYPYGSMVHVPKAEGIEFVEGKPMRGYFWIGDTGGRIQGDHFDLFVGEKEVYSGFFDTVKQAHHKTRIYPLPKVAKEWDPRNNSGLARILVATGHLKAPDATKEKDATVSKDDLREALAAFQKDEAFIPPAEYGDPDGAATLWFLVQAALTAKAKSAGVNADAKPTE